MERAGIKFSLLLIAIGSAVYWAQPPHFTYDKALAACCALWGLVALAAFRLDRAEDWTYRFGSFLGIAMATAEGAAGMLAPNSRAGLLLMACLHTLAFVLSTAGRFQKVSSKRPSVL